MTTWSIKVTNHPEIYLVVAESKRAAISYLRTYLADDLEISNVSEMDDGTIIALDALDSEDEEEIEEVKEDDDKDEDNEGWKNGKRPVLYGEDDDEEIDDADDWDDLDDDDDWEDDDDWSDEIDDDEDEDEEEDEDDEDR